MFGLINLHKAKGVTSRRALDQLAERLRIRKLGHAGTLDPIAEGVLLVAIGKATRLVPFIQDLPKTYLATFQFGRTSDTQDCTGNCQEVPWSTDAIERLPEVAKSFLGLVAQQPPVFSALKVAGKRAYQLGRKGEQVELPVRNVMIHSVEILSVEPPFWTLEIVCSKGTYVRTLGHDMAKQLGTGAVMVALQRLAVGPYRLENSVRIESLSFREIRDRFLSCNDLFPDRDKIVLNAIQIDMLRCAQPLPILVRKSGAILVDAEDRLLAVLDHDPTIGYRHVANFVGT